jgi:ADP-heptose:LPS heptosyltransferase
MINIINDFTNKKIYEYLQDLKTGKIILLFNHGLGDVINFIPMLERLRRDFPDIIMIMGAESKRKYHIAFPMFFIAIDSELDVILENYDLVFSLRYPEPRNVLNITNPKEEVKQNLCNLVELGIPDYNWSPCDLSSIYPRNNIGSKLIGVHFTGNSCSNLKNPKIDISRKICNEIMLLNHDSFEMQINYEYLRKEAKTNFCPVPQRSTFRYNSNADLVALIDKIRRCRFFVGVDSGPLYLAGAIIGYDNCIALQQTGKWCIHRYFPSRLELVDILNYTPQTIYNSIRRRIVANTVAKQEDKPKAKPSVNTPATIVKREKPWKIGVHRRGGFGDALLCTAQVAGVRRKYPNAHIVGFFEGNHKELFKFQPKLVNEFRLPYRSEIETRKRYQHDFDIWYDFKPGGCVHYINPNHPEKAEYLRRYEEEFKYYDEQYQKSLVEVVERYGMQNLRLSKELHNIDCYDSDMSIFFSPADKIILNSLKIKPKKYITIHTSLGRTKSWHLKYIQAVIDYLAGLDYTVVSVGSEDYPIKNCIKAKSIGLRPTTYLVYNSMLHIGTEGYFSHVTAMSNTPCITLYGPTPHSFWGHDNVIPIYPDELCQHNWCWTKSVEWAKKCMITNMLVCPGKCMEQITPDMVINKINGILGVDEKKEETKEEKEPIELPIKKTGKSRSGYSVKKKIKKRLN